MQSSIIWLAKASPVHYQITTYRPCMPVPSRLLFNLHTQTMKLRTSSEVKVRSRAVVASSPGHSQILSCSCSLLPIFLHGCEIKSGSGLGTRLDSHFVSVNLDSDEVGVEFTKWECVPL